VLRSYVTQASLPAASSGHPARTFWCENRQAGKPGRRGDRDAYVTTKISFAFNRENV
jgi:hypothetical protein